MTQEIFDILVKKTQHIQEIKNEVEKLNERTFEDDLNDIRNGITKNPYQCMSDYFKYQNEIIEYINNIDNKYCEMYFNDKKLKKEHINLPEIYILLRKFVIDLNSENYESCGYLKDKIFNLI